jgi:hypothetical protein
MSYDFSIGDVSINYTSNGAALYHDHLPATETRPSGLQAIHGLKGSEAGVLLGSMLQRINNERISYIPEPKNWKDKPIVGEPQMCAKYDSPNGWGSLIAQLIFIGRIAAACAAHPNEIVEFHY